MPCVTEDVGLQSCVSVVILFNCHSNALCHSTVIRTCHLNLSIQMLHHSNVLFIHTCVCGLVRMCWLNNFSQM